MGIILDVIYGNDTDVSHDKRILNNTEKNNSIKCCMYGSENQIPKALETLVI